MKFPKPFCTEPDSIYAVIETPRGSRSKYDYNPKNGFFELNKILPAGTSFPLDFGFVPNTLAEDGDPLDILVLVDEPCPPGTLLKCRPVGVIEATQKEKGKKKVRNDRLIAVAMASLDHSQVQEIDDVNKHLLRELIHFFEYYNTMCGKKFHVLGVKGGKAALDLIKKQMTTK